MAEPYVAASRYDDANTLLTALESAIATIDDDTEAILADKTAALNSRNAAQATAKQAGYFMMLGGA